MQISYVIQLFHWFLGMWYFAEFFFVLFRPSLATGDNFKVATKLSPSETEHCQTHKISPSPAEVYQLLFHIHPCLQTTSRFVLFFIRLYKNCCCMMLYCQCHRPFSWSLNV